VPFLTKQKNATCRSSPFGNWGIFSTKVTESFEQKFAAFQEQNMGFAPNGPWV
jgi:hypothetical protein